MLGLIGWNSSFGAFDRVLLCLHDDAAGYVSTAAADARNIADQGGICSTKSACVSTTTELCQSENCMDIKVSAQLLSLTRTNDVVSSLLIPATSVVLALFPAAFSHRDAVYRAAPSLRSPSPVSAISRHLSIATTILRL